MRTISKYSKRQAQRDERMRKHQLRELDFENKVREIPGLFLMTGKWMDLRPPAWHRFGNGEHEFRCDFQDYLMLDAPQKDADAMYARMDAAIASGIQECPDDCEGCS